MKFQGNEIDKENKLLQTKIHQLQVVGNETAQHPEV